jgi:putative Ca2+/H+ antiporter (TMEM165/GDT1 family)
MHAFLLSSGLVAIAEIGDKTQLLALLLATRFRRPLPIIAGILVATIANHLLAAWAGTLIARLIDGAILRWLLGLSFLAMAGWALIPDRLEDEPKPYGRFGALATTMIAFFLVEMGDKTQIATAALGARFQDIAAVTLGTTFGMMLANVPVVFLGDFAGKRIPLRPVRLVAAGLFAALGVLTLIAPDRWFG